MALKIEPPDLFPVRKRIMQEDTPFGGDPVLEALAKEAFVERKARRRQQGFARGGRFLMAATGVPLERREFLAPINIPGVSYDQATQANSKIHDRIKSLEEYLSSPGASAEKAQEELFDLYKTIITQASNNARQISSNVTQVALERAGISVELAKEFEDLIGSPEKEIMATRGGPKGTDFAEALTKLRGLDSVDKERKMREILLAFGSKFPAHLDTFVEEVYKEVESQGGEVLDSESGYPTELGVVLEKAKSDVEAILAALDKDPAAKEAMDQVHKIDDVLEAAFLAELQITSSITDRHKTLKDSLSNLRGGGVNPNPEVEKLIQSLDALMLKYGNVTNPEQLLELEAKTRPEIQTLHKDAMDSLVEPMAPSDYHRTREALIKSDAFKEFMEANPELSQERAVRLLLRQAKRGKTTGKVAAASPVDPADIEQGAVNAAVDEFSREWDGGLAGATPPAGAPLPTPTVGTGKAKSPAKKQEALATALGAALSPTQKLDEIERRRARHQKVSKEVSDFEVKRQAARRTALDKEIAESKKRQEEQAVARERRR